MDGLRSEGWLRRALCDAGRHLYERGLLGPTDGNFSARVGGRYLLCTPSGAHKGRLEPGDLLKLTLDGRVVSSARGQRPSSELKMHLAIYRLRPEVACVVHAHPPCAVGLTVAGVSLERPVVPEVLFALGAVPNVAYTSPTTDEVPEAIAPVLARCDAFMLARHGSVVLCQTPDEGVQKTEVLEHTAKITLAARIAGGATPLPEAEVTRLLRLAESHRPAPAPTPVGAQGGDAALVDAITRAVLQRLKG
ncbi:MAG: class II aldolase/adducin family protein [Deltaproteobacteria bacterium]|nr:class II aldolase/adducin family protein [Deltaproteobacteria bacterium]